MSVVQTLFYVVVLTFCFLESSLACRGYNITVSHGRSCNPNSVISFEQGFNAYLTHDCYLVPVGCFNTIGFRSYYLNYNYQSGNVQQSSMRDMCDFLAQQPNPRFRCPIPRQRLCVNGQVRLNIAIFSSAFPLMAGKLKIRLTGNHDTGKSCAEADIFLGRT